MKERHYTFTELRLNIFFYFFFQFNVCDDFVAVRNHCNKHNLSLDGSINVIMMCSQTKCDYINKNGKMSIWSREKKVKKSMILRDHKFISFSLEQNDHDDPKLFSFYIFFFLLHFFYLIVQRYRRVD